MFWRIFGVKRCAQKELAPRLRGWGKERVLPQFQPSGLWPITWSALKIEAFPEQTPELSNLTLRSWSLLRSRWFALALALVGILCEVFNSLRPRERCWPGDHMSLECHFPCASSFLETEELR